MKKKLFNVIMTGALTAGVLGTASLPALAATSNVLDTETKAQVDTIMESLKTKLGDLGVELPEKRSPFENLSGALKTKAEAIWAKKEAGTITEAEAKTQLEAIGVTLPERSMGKGTGHLQENVDSANLSAANQTKADAILAKAEAGTITHDEAEEQLAALGVTITKSGKDGSRSKGTGHLQEDVDNADLSAANQTKADAILAKAEAGTITHDEAETQLEALGVTITEGGKGAFLSNLDEAAKAKAEAILDEKKAGTITEAEAKTQLEALGVTLPERGERGGRGPRGDMLEGLDEETKAEAESLIEDAKEQIQDLGVEDMKGMKMQ